MTLNLPWIFDDHSPVTGQQLQDVLDMIATQFPVGVQNVTQVPQVRVFNSAALTIPTSTVTVLTFDSERWDTGGLHSTSVNTSRLSPASATSGLWSIKGSVDWVFNAAGYRQLYVRVNGTTIIAANLMHADAAVGNQQTIATDYRLSFGDYVELVVVQTSGGNLNVNASANYSPEFSMHWVSP